MITDASSRTIILINAPSRDFGAFGRRVRGGNGLVERNEARRVHELVYCEPFTSRFLR